MSIFTFYILVLQENIHQEVLNLHKKGCAIDHQNHSLKRWERHYIL